jgi:hypothetical protein
LSNIVSIRLSNSCFLSLFQHNKTTKMCIFSQMYSYAVEFIRSTDVYEVQRKACHLPAVDYLKFFYYSGICFIGVKDFASALESFMMVITAPSGGVVSAVTISALKKARLVELILSGHALSLPKYTSSAVLRCNSSQTLQLYEALTKHFKEDNFEALLQFVRGDKSMRLLEDDSNYGLAEQVVEALLKFRVKQLTKAYSSLSLADVAAMKLDRLTWSPGYEFLLYLLIFVFALS